MQPRPPGWVSQDFDEGGQAAWAGSQLQTAHAAEQLARQNLAVAMGKLEVVPGTTLAQLGRLDSRVKVALEESVGTAKLYRVEFPGDGSALVRVSADTRRLWQNLLGLR